MASISAATNFGPWSTSFYGNGIKSDGYRDNNALDQRNGVGNLNYTTPDLTAFLTVTGDDQKLGLPGGRIVDPSIGVDELVTNRKGTSTPFDYGNKQGASATAGFTKTLWNGVDLIVDGGYAGKGHQSAFFGPVPTLSSPRITSTRDLKTVVDHAATEHQEPDLRNAVAVLTGIDYYDASLSSGSERPQRPAAGPHLRPQAADARRLLAADHRPVADHRFRLWRAYSEHQPRCTG